MQPQKYLIILELFVDRKTYLTKLTLDARAVPLCSMPPTEAPPETKREEVEQICPTSSRFSSLVSRLTL
jgi:hypothetical protein